MVSRPKKAEIRKLWRKLVSFSVIEVSPVMATKWLSNNPNNRPINWDRVQSFAQLMKDGKWEQNRIPPIEILDNDRLFNGQHRLTAVVQAGIPVKMKVAVFKRNLTMEQERKIDFVLVEGNTKIRPFKMSTTVVTQGLYKSVMGNNPAEGTEYEGANKPVVFVTWFDAIDFCNALSKKEGLTPCYTNADGKIKWQFASNGYRLPETSEWEWAANGGVLSKFYMYSGSEDYTEVAVCGQTRLPVTKQGSKDFEDVDIKSTLADVATLKANELGLYDMSGNVWEWCWDMRKELLPYLRGGSFKSTASQCHISYKIDKNYAWPETKESSVGFRIVCRADMLPANC